MNNETKRAKEFASDLREWSGILFKAGLLTEKIADTISDKLVLRLLYFIWLRGYNRGMENSASIFRR